MVMVGVMVTGTGTVRRASRNREGESVYRPFSSRMKVLDFCGHWNGLRLRPRSQRNGDDKWLVVHVSRALDLRHGRGLFSRPIVQC